MTERKPPGMSFTSWIDQQVNEAAERGAFDDLPGAGKPLSRQGEFDGQTWLREYVRREGGSPQDCLPTPLRLRKEIERLGETVTGLRHEQQVRDVTPPEGSTARTLADMAPGRYHRPRCTTSLNGRRFGFLIGASGLPAW